MLLPPPRAKYEDIRAQLSLLCLVLAASTRGAIPKFSLRQINLHHGAGLTAGDWRYFQELGWPVVFGRELGRNMSKSGTETHFSHQFLASFRLLHASCGRRDLYTNTLDPSLPFPALFAVCKVTPSVGTADTKSDEHQNCYDHQDSTDYPTNIEVIWQREKLSFSISLRQ